MRRNQSMSKSKEKSAILKKTQKDVQLYKLHMNLTSRDRASVTKVSHTVKSKGNVRWAKNDPILAKSVTKPDCMISSKNKKNLDFLRSTDDSNEVGCPKQSHTLNFKEEIVQSSNHIEKSSKAVIGKVQKESGTNNCSSSKVTCQTKLDHVEVITSKSDSYEKSDGTQFLQKHKANLRNQCPRIFGVDISNCQRGESQMVDNNCAKSEVCNMKQLANKDRETSNGFRGTLMEGKTQSIDDIHTEGVVQLYNQTYRPLKKSRQCSITIEDEQVEDRCNDQNVVGGEDYAARSKPQTNIWKDSHEQVEDRCNDQNVVGGEDGAARSTTQTNIWKDSQAKVHVPKPIDKPIWSGIFKINGKEYVSLAGHLSPKSSKVSRKLSGSLPPIVNLTKLSRSKVWPKEWEKSKPSDNNINLYFFPNKMRTDDEQDQLVNELKENDLALCASINEVEMLIFTSTLLPLPYQTFQTKQYLWGVFKPKKDKGIVVVEPLTTTTCFAKEVEKEPQAVLNKLDEVRLEELSQESIFMNTSMASEEQMWPDKSAHQDDKTGSLQGPQSMDFEPKFSQEVGQGDSLRHAVHTVEANTIGTWSTTIPINDVQLDPITGFSKSRIYGFVAPQTPRFEELIRELEREGAILWKGIQ